ncbi:MAG: RNA-binding protein, partial [Candidatus Aenigmatarchaeota archaeon]
CKAIDMEKLCIKPNEKVWAVHIDIHVLDHDGNLMDACGLAAIAALLTTRMPDYDIENEKIIKDTPVEKRKRLPVKDVPVPVTVSKIGSSLVLDACLEEEEARDCQLTVTTTKNGELCAMQKAGVGFFTVDEVRRAVELSLAKGRELRELLPK